MYWVLLVGLEQCRLDMTENDIKTGKELLKEDFIRKNKEWMRELEIMVRSRTQARCRALLTYRFNLIPPDFLKVKTKKKAEIQALSSFGFQYVTEVYLPQKLREGDWI
jgi:meiotic recombination protein SPO11